MIAFLTIASFFLGSSRTRLRSPRPSPAGRASPASRRRHPPPLAEQFHHVGRDADRLGRVHQGPLDGLLDPVAGIGAEPRADLGSNPCTARSRPRFPPRSGPGAPALADVAPGDIHHEAQDWRGPSGLGRPRRPPRSGGRASSPRPPFKQRNFVNLPEIRLQGTLHSVSAEAAYSGHEGSRTIVSVVGVGPHLVDKSDVSDRPNPSDALERPCSMTAGKLRVDRGIAIHESDLGLGHVPTAALLPLRPPGRPSASHPLKSTPRDNSRNPPARLG